MENENFLYENLLPELLCKDQTGPAIPLIMHMNMLRDDIRLENFVNLIKKNVKPGMKVLDLGTGTGILALVSAQCGGVVTAIEAQRTLFSYSENLFEKYFPGKIKIIRNDARFVDLKKEYDFIICEMIDTWLIREVQIQVMNEAVKKFLKPDGMILPVAMTNFIEIVEVDYSFAGFEIPLPYYETKDMKKSCVASSRVKVNFLDFKVSRDFKFKFEGKIPVEKNVSINALRLTSVIHLDEKTDCGGSDWFAPALILPINPVYLDKGSQLTYTINYKAGLGFKNFNYNTEILV